MSRILTFDMLTEPRGVLDIALGLCVASISIA